MSDIKDQNSYPEDESIDVQAKPRVIVENNYTGVVGFIRNQLPFAFTVASTITIAGILVGHILDPRSSNLRNDIIENGSNRVTELNRILIALKLINSLPQNIRDDAQVTTDGKFFFHSIEIPSKKQIGYPSFDARGVLVTSLEGKGRFLLEDPETNNIYKNTFKYAGNGIFYVKSDDILIYDMNLAVSEIVKPTVIPGFIESEDTHISNDVIGIYKDLFLIRQLENNTDGSNSEQRAYVINSKGETILNPQQFDSLIKNTIGLQDAQGNDIRTYILNLFVDQTKPVILELAPDSVRLALRIDSLNYGTPVIYDSELGLIKGLPFPEIIIEEEMQLGWTSGYLVNYSTGEKFFIDEKIFHIFTFGGRIYGFKNSPDYKVRTLLEIIPDAETGSAILFPIDSLSENEQNNLNRLAFPDEYN